MKYITLIFALITTVCQAQTTGTTGQSDCPGGAAAIGVTLNTPTFGTAPYSYSWDDSFSQTGQTLINVATGWYNVVVTDNVGATQTGKFFVKEPPQVHVNMNDLPLNHCPKTQLDVFCTPSGGDGTYTVNWTSGVSGSSLNNTHTPPSASSTMYKVEVTDGKGCTASDSRSVNVYPEVIINVPGGITITAGSSASIVVTVSGGTSIFYTFNWSTGYKTSGSSTSSELIVSPTVTTTYTIYVQDEFGCSSDVGSVTVTVNPV